MKKLIQLIVILFAPGLSISEYRAYRLEVENLETGETREVVSTLDHIQYPQYYPLNPNETINYVESWMCWGRTSRRPACERGLYYQEDGVDEPVQLDLDRAPAESED